MKRCVTAILLFLPYMHVSASSCFVAIHGTNQATISVLFPAFDQVATEGRAVFINPIWAIDIVSVRVDGKLVEGAPVTMSFSAFDDRALTLKAGEQFIYRVNIADLMFSNRDQFSASSYSLQRFSIASLPDEIEISYRVRYPDGSKSPEIVTKSIGRWVVDNAI